MSSQRRYNAGGPLPAGMRITLPPRECAMGREGDVWTCRRHDPAHERHHANGTAMTTRLAQPAAPPSITRRESRHALSPLGRARDHLGKSIVWLGLRACTRSMRRVVIDAMDRGSREQDGDQA